MKLLLAVLMLLGMLVAHGGLARIARGARGYSAGLSIVLGLRAGSSVTEIPAANVTIPTPTTVGLIVSTTVGSAFLDKKKRLVLPHNGTVHELKQQLHQKFPGSPPVELQRLFFGMRLLGDNEVLSNLSTLNPVPLMLDMLTGTSVYNKTLSVSQALEAYAAISVQQAYIGERLRAHFSAGIKRGETEGATAATPEAPSEVETAVYRDMFSAINSSLYSTYTEDISQALVEEADPETLSDDTAAWRHQRKDKSPITVALAQEFDLNFRGMKNFAYYSILLAIFAMFGTNTQASSQLLILMVPLLWVSKLRQLRLLGKLVVNVVLPLIPSVEFLMPLLAAPYQVLAVEMSKSAGGVEEEEVEEGREIEGQGKSVEGDRRKSRRRPVVPVAKSRRV